MIKKCLSVVSSLAFTLTTFMLYPLNANAKETLNPVEIVSLRSEYGKHYDNGDGTYTSYIDSAPLH